MSGRAEKNSILIYVEPDLKEDIKQLADEDSRSMTNYIALVLREHRDQQLQCGRLNNKKER